MDENEKMNNPTQDDDTAVETTKPTADDGEAPSAPAAAPALDPAGLEAALKAYIAATNGATADDENDPAAGDTTDKPTKDEGEGDDPAKPDVLADITARRDAMEDGPAKADINTLLSIVILIMAVLSVVAIRFGYKALLIEWAIDAISKAEKEFVGTKLGEARLAVVVSWLREKVPAPIRFLVTDDLIRKAVQTSFNAAKSGLEVLKNA